MSGSLYRLGADLRSAPSRRQLSRNSDLKSLLVYIPSLKWDAVRDENRAPALRADAVALSFDFQ
jgi:hypothetical protein